MNRREAIKTSVCTVAGMMIPVPLLGKETTYKVGIDPAINKSFSGFQIFDNYLGGPIEPGQRICVAYHKQDRELALHIFDVLGKNCFNICPEAVCGVLNQAHSEELCSNSFETEIIISIKEYPLHTMFSTEEMIVFGLPHDENAKPEITFFKLNNPSPNQPRYNIGEIDV